MKKLLFFLLIFISSSAWTGWVPIANSDSGDTEFYVDPATIRKEGVLRKFWKMVNLKNRNKNGDISFRFRDELDCKEEKFRNLNITTFSEKMLSGEITNNFNTIGKWVYIAPGTLDEAVMEYVCRK
jgi:hypothetical protein